MRTFLALRRGHRGQDRRAKFVAQRVEPPGNLHVVVDCIETDLAIARALQIAGQCVVVVLRDRVELVIVATGTGDGHSQERSGRDVEHVGVAVGFVLTDADRRVDRLAQVPETGTEHRFVET